MNEKTKPATPLDPVEEAIFHAASELFDPPSRAAFLGRACANDATLRSRMETLLQAQDRANQFFADDPLGLATKVEPRADGASSPPALADRPTVKVILPPPEAPAQMIGRYKLLEKIGEGGFGEVWMAEQREPVKRRVALKLIKLGMDSRQIVARFEAERQALAMMDHPNIARVLDAGATPAGRPYFVMELVEGVPITRYCDERRLNLRGIKYCSPRNLQRDNFCARTLGNLSLEMPETTEYGNQNLITGRDDRMNARLQTGACGAIDQHRLSVFGPENLPVKRHHLAHVAPEFRIELALDRHRHGAQNARIKINRTWPHQKPW